MMTETLSALRGCIKARTQPNARTSARLRLGRAVGRWIDLWAAIALALFVRSSNLAWCGDATKIGEKTAREWAVILKNDDPKSRGNAALALSLLGPDANEVVPSLIDALGDQREDVKQGAIDALREIGPAAAAAAPALVRKLGTPGPANSSADRAAEALKAIGPAAVPALINGIELQKAGHLRAARILGDFGPAAKAAVPSLIKMVNIKGGHETRASLSALGAIGPGASAAVPALYECYDQPSAADEESLKYGALSALIKIGARPSNSMIARLDDPDPGRCTDAILRVSEFGETARSLAGKLETLLEKPSPSVRAKAAIALLNVDPENHRFLPALISALDSTDLDVLDDVISAVAKLGRGAKVAAPKLEKVIARTDLIRDKDDGDNLAYEVSQTRVCAAEALVAIAPESGEGVAALIVLLKDAKFGEQPAVDALGRLGPAAFPAVPALLAVARNAGGPNCVAAIRALMRIDGDHPALIPALIARLEIEPMPVDPENGVELSKVQEGVDVITIIGRLGSRALPAVPSLVRLMEAKRDDEQSDETVAAARALGRIGPAAKAAVPTLARVLKVDTDRSVQVAAARALGAMGQDASSAVPELLETLWSEVPRSWYAARVLGSVGADARAAVPSLVECLKDKDRNLAFAAGLSLLRIDPSNQGLVEASLAPICKPDHFYNRAFLLGALGRRTPEADGFTRMYLRGLERNLCSLADLTADDELWIHEDIIQKVEYSLDALGSLRAGAHGAIERLTDLTNHSDPEVQRTARLTLAKITSK
jgi:HEAT repeat protein